MNSNTKAYFLTAMLALSTVSFGLGGVVEDAEAQLIISNGECDPPVADASLLDSDCEDYLPPESVTIPLSGTVMNNAEEAIRTVTDDEDGAPLFPDNGRDGNEEDLQVVVPNSTAVLGSQDTDGDGYSDFEELSGCGTGVPTNPTNPDAHCGDYDGDGFANENDPNPFKVDTNLILSLAKDEYVAPVYGDQLVFEYQCYNDMTALQFTFAVENFSDIFSPLFGDIPSSGALTTATPTAIFTPDPAYPDGDVDDDGDCHEHGLATFPPDFELNATGSGRGDFEDGLFSVVLSADGGITSNELAITVTNAAEAGTWTATCNLNLTTNGYCGTPGENATLNGVKVTYDADRFPDRHPHPSVDVDYEVVWTFNHTSYKSGDGHNLTEIAIENHYTDANCGSNTDNRIAFGEPSADCDRVAEMTETYTFTAPSGFDGAGNPYYTMTTHYNVRAIGSGLPGESDASTAHNQYLVARILDRGGAYTYWGEYDESDGVDDHGKFTHFMAQYSRINQEPLFQYIATGPGPNPTGLPSHDNSSAPYVVHDREDKVVTLRVIVHDDRAYGDVGSPGDDLNVTIHYAIRDDHTAPAASEFVTASNLPSATNHCKGLGVTQFFPETCDFQGDGDAGGNIDDGIDDRVDGTSANSEAYEHIISVDDGKVIHYTFSVIDSDGAEENYGTDFTYVVGELPLDDPPVSTLADSGLSTMIQDLVDEMDDRFEIAAEALTGDPDSADTGDPWDTNENGVTSEPNGQVDVVERFAYYIDTDEGSDRDPAHFDRFDGYDGADGVSLHLAPTGGFGIEETEHPVIRVGNVAGTDMLELIVLTDGFTTLCVVEHPGQADVSLYMGGVFKDPDADAPCGEEISSDLTLKAVQISNEGFTGFIIYNDEDNDDERDGAEDRRSNMEAQSCEDVLIVAINTGDDPSLSKVHLVAAEPYPEDPCDGSDNEGGGPLGDVGDELPEDIGEDSDGDGIPDVVDDEVPEEDVAEDSDGDGVPDAVEDTLKGPLCFDTPAGKVGICKGWNSDKYVIALGPVSGPVLPF